MPAPRRPWISVISSADPSVIAASTTWPSPVDRACSSAGEHAEREQHPAAAEVAEEVQRHGGALPAARSRDSAPESAM